MANKRAGQHTQDRDSHGAHDKPGAVSRDNGYKPRVTNANDQWEPENSRGPRGYGHSQSYGGALGYQDETLRSRQGGHTDTQPASSGSTSGARGPSDENSSSPSDASHGSTSTTPKSK
jgi:hypothetical protein